ncbi:MAG TPA: hypothetical protein V6D16_17015 [Candidatus Obscuribacterales bacterium]
MARKRRKVLSTIRALDKQEPTLTQPGLEDEKVVQPQLQPQLDHLAEESGRGQHELETSSNELMAPFLMTSVLEDQLSELATGTAETLHIAEVTTPEVTTPEAHTPEVTTQEITTQSGETVSDEAAIEVAPDKSELGAATSVESLEALSGELGEPAIAEPEPEQLTEASTIPETSSAQRDTKAPETRVEPEPEPTELVEPPDTAVATPAPVLEQPALEQSFKMQAEETESEQPEVEQPEVEQPADSVSDTSQAIAPNVNAQDLLKRPEAFVLIVCTFFLTLWQAYIGIWKQPAPSRKLSDPQSARRLEAGTNTHNHLD